MRSGLPAIVPYSESEVLTTSRQRSRKEKNQDCQLPHQQSRDIVSGRDLDHTGCLAHSPEKSPRPNTAIPRFEHGDVGIYEHSYPYSRTRGKDGGRIVVRCASDVAWPLLGDQSVTRDITNGEGDLTAGISTPREVQILPVRHRGPRGKHLDPSHVQIQMYR